jgi:branched-chain amino acid transport system substrate-binding protein
VPGIYTKLLDVDKVDLLIGPYATAQIAPAMPIVMAAQQALHRAVGLAVNDEFNYPNYFAMIPSGPDPKPAFTKGFFDRSRWRRARSRRRSRSSPRTRSSPATPPTAPARTPRRLGLKIVYDKTYPPSTTDFAPIVRAIQATNPDLVVICSYPPDSVGLVRAINEIGFKPKMIGGGMVGLQSTALKTQLGPAAQRLRQLRLLAAGAEDAVPRRRRR